LRIDASSIMHRRNRLIVCSVIGRQRFGAEIDGGGQHRLAPAALNANRKDE
jgi:hypothetical protein